MGDFLARQKGPDSIVSQGLSIDLALSRILLFLFNSTAGQGRRELDSPSDQTHPA